MTLYRLSKQCYIDNILIYSPDPQVHISHVRQVLQRLQENHLYVKDEKCEFHADQVTFLGHIISEKDFFMDHYEVKAVTAP